MPYTPSPIKAASSPSQFGGLRTDGNRVAMTGAIANNMQCQDAAVSPVTSPLTNVSAVTGQTLKVPQGAVRITVISSVACQVGEDSTVTYGFSLPANNIRTFDCANQQNVYLLPANGANTINFYFGIV